MWGVPVTSITDRPVVVQPLTASNSPCTKLSRSPITKGSAPMRQPYAQMYSTSRLPRCVASDAETVAALFFAHISAPSSMDALPGIRNAAAKRVSSG